MVSMINDINGDYTSISNITLDSYDITTSGTGAESSGDVGGSSVNGRSLKIERLT